MKKVTIGLLLPTSTILRMGKDFENGLKSGLKGLEENYEIELIGEYIAEGSKEKAEKAISKLTSYDQADVITGILSTRTLSTISEKFDRSKTTFIINNVGEHAPNPDTLSENLFLNSTNLWQQIWSLGYWGVKQFGNKGMYVGGLYDSGYSFTSMLNLGMHAANSEAQMPFAVAPVSSMGELADVKSVFQHIDTFKPDFLFAAFCGEEASMFLQEYKARGLTIPILATPFLLQPFSNEGAPVQIYSSVSSYQSLSGELNGMGDMMENPFNYLGLETGLLIKTALENNQDINNLQSQLNQVKVNSKRGPLHVTSKRPGEGTKVYLVTCKTDGRNIEKQLGEEIPTLSYDDAAYTTMLDNPSSGWYNPYPGV